MTPTLTALDAERAVLGAMLLDSECVPGVLARMSSEAFAEPRHARIYAAMQALHDKGRSSDLVSLIESLKASGALDAVGGASYLSELLGCVATSAHAENHSALILEAWQKRRLVAVGSGIVLDAQSAEPVAEVISRAQNAVFQIAKQRGTAGYVTARASLGPAMTELEAYQASDQEVTGVPTGLAKLDSLLLGLHGGDLVVLAARPSMGKTALALGAARKAAGAGVGVAFFSLEMKSHALMHRILSSEANVNSWKMKAGRLVPNEWRSISEAAGRLAELPIYIDDSSALSHTSLAARARLMASENDVGLVVVDYLQLVRGPKHAQSREREVAEVSLSCKALARDLDVPVLLLSQLSRACDYRENKRPLLSDLRDSGSIEQDADVVMFVYRDGKYKDPDDTNGHTELLVRKNRNGPTGTVYLKFNAPTTSFTDWEEGF